MNQKSKKTPKPSLDLVLQEMEELRKIQTSAIDSLDTKIGITIGFTDVILTIYISAFESNTVLTYRYTLIGLTLLLISFGLSIWAFWIRGFKFNPNPDVLKNDYMKRDPNDWNGETPGSKEQILADKVEAYNSNEGKINRKAKLINSSIICLALGISFLIINPLLKGGYRMFEQERTAGEESPEPSSEGNEQDQPVPPNPEADNVIPKGADPNPDADNIIPFTGDDDKPADE